MTDSKNAALENIAIRDVTDEEISNFREKGWSKLPGLIPPELVTELQSRAAGRMGASGDDHDGRDGDLVSQGVTIGFHDYSNIADDDELYGAVLRNPQMGRNAARLFGRDMAIRSMSNMLAVKLPAVAQEARTGVGITNYHQDQQANPITGNSLVFWIALVDLTPDMGTMRFHEGSQNLGLLTPPVEDWEILDNYPLSEPFSLKAGDATVHHSFVVHGAPANTTEAARWVYLAKYFPAEAPYNGAHSRETDGLDLALGEPIADERLPLVYTP